MGTGASKKATADAEKASFDDDDTDEDFDTYSKKKVAANSKSFSRLEHNGLLPKLQSVAAFGKSKEKKKDSGREIVGLDDDSDVEEITSKKPGQRAKAEEKELKNEIIELEKTFENLDLDNSIGGGSINSTHRKPFTRGLYRSSTIDESYSHNQRTQNSTSRTGPSMAFVGGPFGTPAMVKPLKFSWEEPAVSIIVDKDNEDWNYQQTVIDGFDPDKFRKVNKDSKNSSNYDTGIHVERQFNSSASSNGSSSTRSGRGATEIPTMEMPGVPSYDNSERQLLASLEQELGVL